MGKKKLTTGYILWQVLIGVAIAISVIEAPLSFVLELPISKASLLMDCLLTMIFIIDFLYNFRIFIIENINNRLKRWWKEPDIWIDFLASIPFDIIVYLFGIPLWIRVFRLIRMLRMLKFVKMFVTIGNLTLVPGAVKIAFVLTGTVVTINAVACGWMWIYPTTDNDLITFYIKAIYWTITTLTTVGYGDISPSTNLGRIYTMIIMVMGVGVYGIVIGSISRIISMNDRFKEQSKEKLNDLKNFMEYYELPESLSEEVFGFYGHLLTKRLSDNDEQIISELPNALQREIKTYMNMKLIGNVPAFKLCSQDCLKEIAKSLKQMALSPSEFIIKKGDIGNEMFIIGHGTVEVIVEENIVATLRDGQFFGEVALLEKSTRNADVRSQTYCDMYRLNKDDFLKIIKTHPELLKSMEKFMSKKAMIKEEE